MNQDKTKHNEDYLKCITKRKKFKKIIMVTMTLDKSYAIGLRYNPYLNIFVFLFKQRSIMYPIMREFSMISCCQEKLGTVLDWSKSECGLQNYRENWSSQNTI